MSAPTGALFYVDFKYGPDGSITLTASIPNVGKITIVIRQDMSYSMNYYYTKDVVVSGT
jgi:hypothetical protein